MRSASAPLALAALAALTACATGSADYADPSADRISDGMRRLGASEARSGCYAADLSRSLKGADRAEAERLIENAQSRDDMREGVLGSSKKVKQAFIRAHFRCPNSA